MADLLPVHAIYEGSNPKYYFRTSDVYGESGGIGGKVGIKKVPVANLLGNEELIPVKELLRTGTLLRIGIRYKDSNNKRKSAKLLVSQAFVAKLFGEVAAEKLEGQAYKIGNGNSKGNIDSIGMIRKAHTY
jgi:hypothetical protein